MLSAYIAALQARVQLPHVVVFLDASPSSCAGRCGLPEAELLELDRDFRSLASRLTIKGSAVYRRNWDALGSVNQVRDTILCAEPQRGWSKTLAPIDVAQVMQVRVPPVRARRALPKTTAALCSPVAALACAGVLGGGGDLIPGAAEGGKRSSAQRHRLLPMPQVARAPGFAVEHHRRLLLLARGRRPRS